MRETSNNRSVGFGFAQSRKRKLLNCSSSHKMSELKKNEVCSNAIVEDNDDKIYFKEVDDSQPAKDTDKVPEIPIRQVIDSGLKSGYDYDANGKVVEVFDDCKLHHKITVITNNIIDVLNYYFIPTNYYADYYNIITNNEKRPCLIVYL